MQDKKIAGTHIQMYSGICDENITKYTLIVQGAAA
jgi:hypothetical protein